MKRKILHWRNVSFVGLRDKYLSDLQGSLVPGALSYFKGGWNIVMNMLLPFVPTFLRE
jgi:hypothetical protein